MAYSRTSAGPAGRPGACISQFRFQFRDRISIPRHFLIENRPLVDFQIGNEGHGGDLDENGCFTSRKCVLRWTAMDLEAISFLISKYEMGENENSARPRCDFIYTKNSARPRSEFIYTKNFQEGRCDSCLTVSVLRVRFLCGNRWGRS